MMGQSEHRSESKILVGQKRGGSDVEEDSGSSENRTKKMRDMEAILRSEAQAVREGTANPDSNSVSRELDLNVKVSAANCKAVDDGNTKTRAFALDLNSEDISRSSNGPFFPAKNYHRSRLVDDFECGSSVGPLDGNDSMGVWKGLKQNNYMTNLYGSAPSSMPKPRGRKRVNNNNNELMKKKMIELAKKEQVDRFARVAAPSGLLNGLNPGIINHVRNSKQVHSIIEALVRSEKNEKQNQIKTGGAVDVSGFGVKNAMFRGDYGFFSKTGFLPSPEISRGDENDKLGSENTSCLSNEESGNLGSANSLSVKAANVASQWLDLLNQDIKGRLAALKRSKRRVCAVISTELPLLMSREFSSNHFDQATADAHSVRWNSLFKQMDKALSDEERQLESWLDQVKEMQLHCEKGLLKSTLPQHHDSRLTGSIGNESRLGAGDKVKKDLAARAAAASIYSTCNFLLLTENS